MNRKLLGKQGEDLAVKFLKKKGYRILDRNFYTSRGELDIVAYDGENIVFAEVKTRKSENFARPEYAVNYTKQNHLRKAALLWLSKNYPIKPPPCRFDVISVLIKDGEKPLIEHIIDAFM